MNVREHSSSLLAILLSTLLVLLSGCGKEDKQSGIPRGASVLAIGDSVTFGTGAEKGQDFPAQLAIITRWTIHNHGIPGDTAAGVSDRIVAALVETQPVLVLLEIGGNDFLRRTPEAEVKEQIRAILKQIRLQGIPVMLVAVPQFSPLGAVLGRLPDAPLYAELGREEQVAVIPDVLADVLSDDPLKADAIHPNGAGYKQLAEGIADALTRTGYYRP
ncbi:MAG: GDSL-type esterase/lipase family protein [Pseudomonadota bacterium]